MKRCEDCKLYGDGTCEWWLCAVNPTDKFPDCFIPAGEPEYPRMPRQMERSRENYYPGPHGRCFYCGTPLSGRKISYCSDKHGNIYYSRFNWLRVRSRIWNRDNKRCVLCNTPVKFDEVEADHIQAVSLGGSYWDYANLQTLCHDCHSKKTGEDRMELHKKQRREAILTENYSLDLFMET